MKLINKILQETYFPQEIKNSGFSRTFSELFFIPLKYKPRLRKKNNIGDFLFVIMYSSHLKQALPIIRKLKLNNVQFSILLLNYNFKSELDEFKDRLIFINNLYSFSTYLLASISQIYNFFSFKLLNNTNMTYRILKFYKISYLIICAIKLLFEKNNIKKIILFKGDGIYARTISKYVKSNYSGTKLIAIQHGLIASSKIHSNLSVDEFWVWSNFFKMRLEKSNVGCSIKVVGDPHKDELFNQSRISKKLNEKNIKILFAPNSGNSFTSLDQVIHSCNIIDRFARENININILVKPHPGDTNNNVKDFFVKKKSKVILLDSQIDVIERRFFDVDIVIINNSGILNEAAIFKIPGVIVAQNLKQVWVNQYVDYGIAKTAKNYVQFNESINFVVSNYKSFEDNCIKLTNITYENQGNASEKILNKLKS